MLCSHCRGSGQFHAKHTGPQLILIKFSFIWPQNVLPVFIRFLWQSMESSGASVDVCFTQSPSISETPVSQRTLSPTCLSKHSMFSSLSFCYRTASLYGVSQSAFLLVVKEEDQSDVYPGEPFCSCLSLLCHTDDGNLCPTRSNCCSHSESVSDPVRLLWVMVRLIWLQWNYYCLSELWLQYSSSLSKVVLCVHLCGLNKSRRGLQFLSRKFLDPQLTQQC